jgi:mannosyltransferase
MDSELRGGVVAEVLDVESNAPSRETERGRGIPWPPAEGEPRRRMLVIAGITLFGAVLRFSTLDLQSFWFDEAYTIHIINGSLGHLFSMVHDADMNPPLYYLAAHGWTQLFGTGEVGLRSLSAFLGTATIPVAYAVASRLGGFRAGWMAALLVATNPFLVWYSQEARSYALLAFLGIVSVLCFIRAREELDRRWLAGWAISSALALAAHYAALFLVVPEAAWLGAIAATRRRNRFQTGAAIGVVATAGAALLPLALHQYTYEGTDWIGKGVGGPLGRRLVGTVPAEALTGYHPPHRLLLALVAASLSLGALVLLLREGTDRSRRGGAVVIGLCAAVVFGAFGLALAGEDLLITRNVITVVAPLLVAVAIGAAAMRSSRLGIALCGGLCALGVVIVAITDSDGKYQRDDWRDASEALADAPGDGPTAVVATPRGYNGAETALSPYLSGISSFPGSPRRVAEIDLLNMATREPGSALHISRPPTPPSPAPGFRFASRTDGETFTLVRFEASSEEPVSGRQLASRGLGGGASSVLLLAER